jgi:hypothetical protein
VAMVNARDLVKQSADEVSCLDRSHDYCRHCGWPASLTQKPTT